MSNPFKIIESNEQAPEKVKKELKGSIENIVLILRFVQLFMGDYTAAILNNFKINFDDVDASSEQK